MRGDSASGSLEGESVCTGHVLLNLWEPCKILKAASIAAPNETCSSENTVGKNGFSESEQNQAPGVE